MENAKKFFEEIIKTEEAKGLIASTEAPATEEARIAAYIDIAGKLGVELTADEINAYFAANIKADLAELDDEELSQLAGGADPGAGHAECESTYTDKEFCWSNDGCDQIYNDYADYYCKLLSQKPLTEEEKREIAKKKVGGACGQRMTEYKVHNNF